MLKYFDQSNTKLYIRTIYIYVFIFEALFESAQLALEFMNICVQLQFNVRVIQFIQFIICTPWPEWKKRHSNDQTALRPSCSIFQGLRVGNSKHCLALSS